MKKICKNCLYLHPQQPICTLGLGEVDPATDYCPKFLTRDSEIGYCAICHQPVYTTNGVIDPLEGDNYRILHRECAKALNTCQTCANSHICEFDTNPDPMPKIVMQTVRQGNMTMQTQVRNPSRVEKFCKECFCFDPNFGCFKENNCCKDGYREQGV